MYRNKRLLYKVLIFISITLLISLIYMSQKIQEYEAILNELTDDNTDEINKYERKLRIYESGIVLDLGKNGENTQFTDAKDIEAVQESFKKDGLNTLLSNRMPLNRTLSDYRNPGCRKLTYKTTLKASVIIPFCNELLSMLLRTVWSVILRTPTHLLHEIILVNDGSIGEDFKSLLQYYIDTRLKNYNVKLIRHNCRKGLIKAKLHGADASTGDVLVFLDSHCEATVGWIEPLLARIEEDRTAVAIPVVDTICYDTMAYSTCGKTCYHLGGFTWDGHFMHIGLQNENDRYKIAPIKSPTMSGGLFAIDRKYFWEIGSYDEQMDGWGGENLEMSFRIWQCGGRIELIPCSRVGHMSRLFHPYTSEADTHAINTARLVYVWMDEYKRIFFRLRPELENNTKIGDLTDRIQLRRKLKCKSFKWYLEEVYPEKFIPDERVFAYGQVRNKYDMCLDTLQVEKNKNGYTLGLFSCHSYIGFTQSFSLSLLGELRNEHFCAQAFDNSEVLLMSCNYNIREQFWVLYKNGTIYNPSLGKCLTSEGVNVSKVLKIDTCRNSGHQEWKFTTVNSTAIIV